MITWIYLLLLLISAIFFGKLAERLKQPMIVGNILGGLLFGPLFILLMEWSGIQALGPVIDDLDPVIVGGDLDFLMQFSIVMVMFASGLETQIAQFIRSFKTGFLTAMFGVIFPLVLGFVGSYLFLHDWLVSLFIGGALSITSVAISLTTLIQIDALNKRFGIAILNAAIADDVIGIVILSVLLSIAKTGDVPKFLDIGFSVGVAIGFVAFALFVMPLIGKVLFKRVKNFHETEALGYTILVAGLIALAAHLAGLHLMIGALLGGMAVRESLPQDIRESMGKWAFGFFGPIFFAWVGFSVTFKGMALSWFVLVIIFLGWLGKGVGAAIGAKISGITTKESFLVGIGMNGRAGVELVLVAIALEMEVITRDIYSAVVYNAIVMSLLTPVLLKWAYSYFSKRGKPLPDIG